MVTMSVLQQHKLQDVVKSEFDANTNQDSANNAKTFVLFSMNREHRNKISHCTTAAEIWSAISNIYENKSKRAINTLWKRLFNYRIHSIDHISDGISEMQTIISSLRTRNVHVEESCLIGCIECALPADFNDWLVNWSMREHEPDFNELVNAINNHVEILKSTETKAMIATLSVKPALSEDNKSGLSCKYCKKPGHTIAECRKLKRKKAEQQQAQIAQSPPSGAFAMMASTSHPEKSSWLADSGASLHMTPNLSWIQDYTPLVRPVQIRLGDDRFIQAEGFGKVITTQGVINNVHYVPLIGTNLLSLPSATDQGVTVITDQQSMRFYQNNIEIARGIRSGKVHKLFFDIKLPQTHAICAAATLEEWHQRFGHIATSNIKRILDNKAVVGLDIGQTNDPCKECALNKCTKASHPTSSTSRANKPGQVLHLDTCGPISPVGIDESRFILICKDEHSGFRIVATISSKSQIP